MYELHPLCVFFPRLDGEEFAALVDDVRRNGLRQPIVLHGGMILDGGNRYRACLKAGVEPKFIEHDGSSVVQFVLSANLHRRHLTPGQRTAIVASAQDWATAQTRGGDRKSDQTATLPFDSVADRAAASGASDRTQRMADKVVKADRELGVKVAHGEISLPRALEQVEGPKSTRTTTEDRLRQQIAELEEEVAELRQENDELRQQAAETLADNTSMSRVFDANDQVSAAIAEARRFREMNRLLEERVRGLQNERNEAIRAVKRAQRAAA